MVSTRHHPRPFPEPDLTPSRPAPTPTATTRSANTSPPPSASPTKRKSTGSTAAKPESKETKELALTSKSPTRRTRTRSKSTRSLRTYIHTPSPFLLVWLIVSLPLVIWDTIYVLGRPHTMPGGFMHLPFWKPYALYGTVDYIYGFKAIEDKNGFTAAQGFLNAVETAFYVWYLVVISRRVATGDGFIRGIVSKLNVFARKDDDETSKIIIKGGEDVAIAVVGLFAAAVMTLSKTVLYWANEYFSGFNNIGHNDLASLFWLWIVPNGAWLVLPTYMVYILGKEIVDGITLENKA